MCGIFGYVGNASAADLAIDGLKKMEYRGYDSAGIAGLSGGQMVYLKEVGKVRVLEEAARQQQLKLDIAIAHTRWATHGQPTQVNAHPHFDVNNALALVHNGIIENYQQLREQLKRRGVAFVSETDSEVVAQLIGLYYEGDLLSAVQRALPELQGAFAIGVLHQEHPEELVVATHESPLAIGLGSDENFVASDVNAFLAHARDVIYMETGEVGRVTADEVQVFDENGQLLSKERHRLEGSPEDVSKGGYEHFTLKEICEQPQTAAHALLGRVDPEHGTAKLDELSFTEEELRGVRRILILACGTSFHAGLVAQYMIEEMARIPCEIEISSEFRYKNPIVQDDTLAIAISQSGETADTLAAVRELKAKGARVLALCNVRGSSLVREAGSSLLLRAGPEIGVASTKAYTNQLLVLSLFALYMARLNDYPLAEGVRFLQDLQSVPLKIQQVLDQKDLIETLAREYARYDHFFFIGRQYMYPTALEAALKFKEISYINASGYPAGELKHGPIALIDPECPTIAFCSNQVTLDKIISNLMEVRARRGKVIAVVTEGTEGLDEVADGVIPVPQLPDPLATLTSAVVGQLFAYYAASERGAEIDQPRNLAKSVTVE